MNFFQTILGKNFFEHHVPTVIKQIIRLNENLERANELKERELAMKERELSSEKTPSSLLFK